eukprot:Nitzschia sp. Nitz4//scaffold63_size106090//16519//18168//NITZ4_004380-RA/size106090-processed-gene-0.118-mRNA-1//1//CDS//3329555945//4301//frame0
MSRTSRRRPPWSTLGLSSWFLPVMWSLGLISLISLHRSLPVLDPLPVVEQSPPRGEAISQSWKDHSFPAAILPSRPDPPLPSEEDVKNPPFMQRLVHQRRALEASAAYLNLNDTLFNDSSSYSWKLAPTAPNQSVTFQPFWFPRPSLPTASPHIVVLILSHQDHLDQRQSIRETWTKNLINHDHIHYYFVVGYSSCNTTETFGSPHQDEIRNWLRQAEQAKDGGAPNNSKPNNNGLHHRRLALTTSSKKDCINHHHAILWREQEKFGDLLVLPMAESYRLLPEKLVQAFHWALSELPSSIQWFVKADDDTFVRPSALHQYLQKYNAHVPMWIGKIVPHSMVSRTGKWAQSVETYPGDYYPMWAQGSAGYVLSRPAVSYIDQNSASLHRYQGEDVSVGIWLDQAYHAGKLPSMTYIQAAPHIVTNKGTRWCGTPSVVLLGHDLSVEEMSYCFAQFNATPTVYEVAWIDEPANFETSSVETPNNDTAIKRPTLSKEEKSAYFTMLVNHRSKNLGKNVDVIDQPSAAVPKKGRVVGYQVNAPRDHLKLVTAT